MTTNAALANRRLAAVPRGVAHATDVYAARAENAELWDVEGRRYIDFAGGISVLNTGHRHPKIMAAVSAQMEKFTHTAFQVAPYESYIVLAERLNKLAPFSRPAKSVFFTTGAEAVENALKFSRAATGRGGVISFSGSFHGRTAMTTALTGKVAPYKKMVGLAIPEIFHVPFPVPHHGIEVADSLRALEFLFRSTLEPTRVAAIIIEPVQGEGGFYEAPPELLSALRRICDDSGIVLIADEVQTGFGRTGRMFAIEHSGVEPDLITIGKSLAGGFPLSGVIGRADIMDRLDPGGLGGTYAGSPFACAAALAVLDIIEDEKLLSRADVIGKKVAERLAKIAARNDVAPIGQIRALGAMIAFEIFKTRGGNDPDPDMTRRVLARAVESGLIVISCGVFSNAVRMMMPLTISDQLLDEGMSLLERAVAI